MAMAERIAVPALQPGDLRLVAGLGNPGETYRRTRHNVGFMALELVAAAASAGFRNQKRLHGLMAEVGSSRERLRLLMPQTYMNDCGHSIRAGLDWYGLQAHQLLVLVDDMDIPLGHLRARACGSAGGHNGLRSIIKHLGHQHFARLRIGIGAPSRNPADRKARTVGHVLGSFNREEEAVVQEVLQEVVEGIGLIQRHGLAVAMNRLNAFRATNPAG